MKKLTTLLLFVCCTSIFSCINMEKNEQPTSKTEKELRIKLEATEAQLLNVRAELSKCKGEDSQIEADSLITE